MHYPLCVLVDVRVSLDERPVSKIVREDAEKALEVYKDLAFDYLSNSPDKFPWLDSLEIFGKDNPALFFELLDEFRQAPLANAKQWLTMAVSKSRSMSSESAKTWLLADNEENDANEVKVIINDDVLTLAFSTELHDNAEVHFFENLAYALSAATGEFKTDSCFYSACDDSTKVSSWAMSEIRSHPERFALVFFDLHR